MQKPTIFDPMELPVRKKLPHTVPPWVREGSWFFITQNCVPRGENHLCRADTAQAVLNSIGHYHEHHVWHCRLCLLMPDHLHAIMAFPREPGMQTVLRSWKKYITQNHDVAWQRDFFDHRLRNPRELEEKTSYILQNPVRKGLCAQVGDWPWIFRLDYRAPDPGRGGSSGT